jgi:hypothetical protein
MSGSTIDFGNGLRWPGMDQNWLSMAGYSNDTVPTNPMASPIVNADGTGILPGATGVNGVLGAAGAAGPTTPAGIFAGTGIGRNLGTLQLGVGGLQALAGLYTAWQASDLAKKTFSFNRDMANTNLGNQIRSYNTALSDRARSREIAEGGQHGFNAQRYIEENKATR